MSCTRTFIDSLHARWAVEDEGAVSDLLGVEISHVNDRVTLKQPMYISKLVAKWFPESPPVQSRLNKLPADESLLRMVVAALSSDEDRPAELVRDYQSLVGALLYAATNTRPDIAFAVG